MGTLIDGREDMKPGNRHRTHDENRDDLQNDHGPCYVTAHHISDLVPSLRGMIAQPTRASLLSKLRLAHNSILSRILVNHERSLAFIGALVAAAVAFEPRIRGGGFAADDWAVYADVKFPIPLGFHSSLAALLSSAGSRVGASLYWLAGFSLFGSHTRLYSLLAALLAVVMAFSIYLLLRELRFSIAQSLAMMLLTIVNPTVATVRFWFTPSGSQISLALFFFGLILALRAFSADEKNRRLRLHVASWALYVLSALYAEVALPLMVVGVLVYLTRTGLSRSGLLRSLRRWAFDVLVVIVGYLTTASFVNSTAGFSKLPRSMWGEHARLLSDQALTIFTRMLAQATEGTRLPVLIGLGLLATAGLLLSASRRTSQATRQGMRRWAIAFGVSLLAIVACYGTYVPAMLYYEPLGPGLPGHINIVIAAPLAVGVFAVVMFAWVVIAEVLDRLRPGTGRFALGLVVAWFAVVLVHGVRDVRSDGRIWAAAGHRGLHVLHVLRTDLAHPLHGSTIYTFGEAGTAAVGLPVFFSSFELTNAVKITYGRGDLSAYPVVIEDDVVSCGAQGITVLSGASRLNQPSPYGRSYFFDVPSGMHERIDTAKACTAALSKFHPGPYVSGPALPWSTIP